ncbi:FAD-binding protein [Mangrovicoccus algicola]|uniref:FAD-binding protein n=1 Tax=Mangrovicoccus algicola TaxID=2771008 RepID=A0A8J7CWZ2_9RHOB|nr:FAD-binding protein [Mangrovicoccus algicola]MBE3638352.1 FAD-binding protein [Mangrovicoccus algicola]
MTPQDEAELAGMIRAADGPLAIRGGGTRSPAATRPVLSTAGLSGIVLYQPGALTLVVKAGTSLSEVEAVLAERNQRLAFEPMDHRPVLGTTGEPTIGGAVAVNASGPRRVQAGAARDFLLGAVFIDGAGTRVRNGGRVMKNVTGYDLARLQAGARGTLGVLTELSFKVLPVPERIATLALPCDDPGRAVAALARALGSPYEVTGAGWDGARVLLRIEGFAASVSYRGGELARLIPGLVHVDEDPWPALRDGRSLAGMARDIWRVSLRASHGAILAARLLEAGAAVTLDWGGGLLWAAMAPGADLRAQMADLGGHATRLRGTGPGPALHPDPAAVAALASGLRRQFDPEGRFAPEA